jgi:outer membrane protein TolC
MWYAVVLSMCLVSMPIIASPSLGEIVASASARNPGSELSDSRRALAAALQRKADQPFADAPSANLKYQTDRIGSDIGYREWEGGVELPLWLPGQADSYAREAGGQRGVADAMSEARLLQITGEVRERLWTAMLARSDAEQARDAEKTARALFDNVTRRVDAGELPNSDRLLAEKELVLREGERSAADNRALAAARLFTRYTGLGLPAQPSVEVPVGTREIDLQHARLQLLQRDVDRARQHRDRVSAGRSSGPSVWLGAKSARDLTGEDYDSAVGVELSMPFGTKGHSAPALAEAELALTQAQVDLSRTRLQLEDALTQAQLDLDRASAALAQTERRRDLSEASLRLSQRAFELGETDLVRLLQAQADALSARHEFHNRELEHGRAIARLNQALGVIPQ